MTKSTVHSFIRLNARSRALIAPAALAILAAGSGFAAEAVAASSGSAKQVKVADDLFQPAHVKIKPGQKVIWTWANTNLDSHNVTLVKGPSGVSNSHFTSKTHSRHYTFSRKFKVAGKYHFVCTIHPFMTLTVVVKK